jgi:AraC-like DNA-binding protein
MAIATGRAVLEVKAISGRPGPRRPHEHDEHSAAFVVRGATRARVAEGSLEAGAGQLVLIAAGVPHECRPMDPSSWGYTLFLIKPGASRILDETLALAERGALVLDARRASIASLAEEGARAPRGEVIAAVEEALGAFRARSLAAAGADRRPVAPWLAEIEAALRRSISRNASLDELARRAGMDKYELVRSFKASYGLSPHAYLLNLKINKAKELLRSGKSPVEAAFACGFCDQSHFTKAFSGRVGLCPAEYARTYKTGAGADR